MSNPAIKDFDVQRRATFPIDITFKANGSAVDITGYTFAASVFSKDRSQSYGDFSVTYTNRSQGKVLFKLTPTQTAALTPNELQYDIKYKQPDNDEFYLLEGTLYISEGYTVIS